MLWNHNTTPPKALSERGSTVLPDGQRVAWSEATPESSLNDLGIYLQGTDDPVPVGYVVDTEERVVRNGNSVLHRTFKPAPPLPPAPLTAEEVRTELLARINSFEKRLPIRAKTP